MVQPKENKRPILEHCDTHRFQWGNHWCQADISGALFIESIDILVVSDLHLEKASYISARGQFLPPYDTAKTLLKLNEVIERYQPRMILSLGDAFHDGKGRSRLSAENAQMLESILNSYEFEWIVGNHDVEELQNHALKISAAMDLARNESVQS